MEVTFPRLSMWLNLDLARRRHRYFQRSFKSLELAVSIIETGNGTVFKVCYGHVVRCMYHIWWSKVEREVSGVSHPEFKVLTVLLADHLCSLVSLNFSIFI